MRNRLFVLLIPFLWLSGKPATAQLFDDFSDGDFSSNPAWTGMTDNFSAASGQLRTTNFSIGSLHLFTASDQPFYSWEFYFRLAFNPSSGNYAEFWLSSDTSNLSQAQNGYFVKIGGNTGDGIGLYKKSGGNTITLINQDGNTLVNGSSNNFGFIRVTRTEAGVWTISEKITSADFLQFGTATDNGLTGSKGLGIRVISTSSNLTKHYFDAIRAEGLLTIIQRDFDGIAEARIIPNPGRNKFQLIASGREASASEISILNAKGKTVQRVSLLPGENTFELPNQPEGLYFLQFQENGIPRRIPFLKN